MSNTIDRLNGFSGDAANKLPCKVATIANITLSGEQTIDGIACVTGDRVLVKNQTNPIYNGVWVASTSAWTRAKDFDGAYDIVHGSSVYAFGGNAQPAALWRVGTLDVIVIGITAISFFEDTSRGAGVTTLDGLTDVSTAGATTQGAIYGLEYNAGIYDVTPLATVAGTGSYADLTIKPLIPSKTSDLTNDSGFITSASQTVVSVAGKTGTITLVSGDISDFTEAAQDVVGALVQDSATINATYDDTGAIETLDVIAKINDLVAATGNYSMGTTNKIINAADPTNPQDYATKNYTDIVAAGLRLPNPAVRAATTAALAANTYANGALGVGATLTATGNGAIAAQDGITLVLNDRLLVKNEATAANNGIYFVSQVGTAGTPYILTRATDADQTAEVGGGLNVFVSAGTTQATGRWIIISPTGAVTMGTTAITFALFSQSANYTAGTGLALTGTVFAIDTTITVDKTSAQTLTTKTLTSPVLNGSLTGSGILNDGTLAANSATAVPTQASVKTYVDAHVQSAGGFFNVKNAPYNAVGDGVTNDTAAIQAALTAAYVAGGGVVYMPQGIYGVLGDGTDSHGALTTKDNVVLMGAGMGATTIKLLAAQQALGDITGIVRTQSAVQNKRITFSTFTIDGNLANVTTRVIGLYMGVSPSHRATVAVSGTTATFTTLSDDGLTPYVHGLTNGSTIYIMNDNFPELNGDFVIAVTGASSFTATVAATATNDTIGYTWFYNLPLAQIADEDITCLEVEVMNCNSYGFDPHERVRRLVLMGCKSHDNGPASDGFTFDGVYDCAVIGCYAYNNGRNGFNPVTNCNNVIFDSCHAYNNGQYGFTAQRGSTTVPRNKNCKITNSSSYGNVQHGIRLQMCSEQVISGNHLYNNGRNGIKMDGPTNSIISNNVFRDNGQTTTNTYDDINVGDYLFAADNVTYPSSGNIISGNIFNASVTKKTRYNIKQEADSSNSNHYIHNEIINKGASGDYNIVDPTSSLTKLFPIYKNIKDYGAKGDAPASGAGGTDDTAAFQAAFNDMKATGGRYYIPAGRYRITAPISATFTYTLDKDILRPSIIGDGPGSSQILYDGPSNPTAFMLNILRTDVADNLGLHGWFNISGISFKAFSGAKAGYIGGLKLQRWAHISMDNVWGELLTTGLSLSQIISSSFTSVKMLDGTLYGINSVGGTIYCNNALTFTGCEVGGNALGGLRSIDGSINYIGGSCEANGQGGTAGTGFGMYFSNTLQSAPQICNLHGVYFEANGTTGDPGTNPSTADIWFNSGNTTDNVSATIHGCNFNRLPTFYAPYGIYVNKSSLPAFNLSVTGCHFTGYGYTASANRRYIKFAGSSTNLATLTINEKGNYYNEPTELPDFVGGGAYYKGVGHKPGALVYASGSITIPASTITALSFNTASYNNYGIWNSATRLTVPAGATLVRLVGNIRFALDAATNASFNLFMFKNGATSGFPGMGYQDVLSNTDSTKKALNCSSAILNVVAGDYFELMALHDSSSGSLGTDTVFAGSTWFSMEVIG